MATKKKATINENPPDIEVKPTEPIKEKPKDQPAQPPKTLATDTKTGLMVARDNGEVMRIINILNAGMVFPKSLDTPQKQIAAWQVAASLGLPPAVTMANLAIIHGSVSMWGQLPKALAERTGQLMDFQVILFDSNQNEICLGNKNLQEPVWGAVARIRRMKRRLNEYAFTELDAKKANLFSKAGPWQDYRKIMYMRRAVGHATKFEFPDALMGVPVAEYDFNFAPDMEREVGGTVTGLASAEDINKEFGDNKTEKENNDESFD